MLLACIDKILWQLVLVTSIFARLEPLLTCLSILDKIYKYLFFNKSASKKIIFPQSQSKNFLISGCDSRHRISDMETALHYRDFFNWINAKETKKGQ